MDEMLAAAEKQKRERGVRKQKRDERQIQMELEKRHRQLQTLRESIDREIKEKTRITEGLGLDLEQEPNSLDEREESLLLQYIESMNALDEDVCGEKGVDEDEAIENERRRKLDYAGKLQDDNRNEFGNTQGQYEEADEEDLFDYMYNTEHKGYMVQFSRRNREGEIDQQQNSKDKAVEVKGIRVQRDTPLTPKEELSTPTFLKMFEDSVTDVPKSIIKKDSSTPILDHRKSSTEVSDAEHYNVSPGKNVLERVKTLQLQAEMMAQKRKQRLYEESKLKERMMEMERRKKKLDDETERRRQIGLIRQDEERLGKLLKRRQLEEIRQRRELEMLYTREAELKRELEESERQARSDLDKVEDAVQLQEEERRERQDTRETELFELMNRCEKDRRNIPVVKPTEILEKSAAGAPYALIPNLIEHEDSERKRNTEQSEQKEGVIKHEHGDLTFHLSSSEEMKKLMAYITELRNKLTNQKVAEEKRIQAIQAAQEEEVKKKDILIRKLEENLTVYVEFVEGQGAEMKTESEENQEHECALTERGSEMKRKENYLKQLEKELQCKENEIRTRLNLDKVAVEETLTEAKTAESTKKSQPDGSNETTTKTNTKSDDKNEHTSKTEVTHLVKPFVNSFSGIDPTPKNESSFEEWRLETQYLMDCNVYPAYIVNQAIRNSLRGQARKVLVTLGPRATSKDIKEKLECIFGNVATGESVLQEFYNATQKENESVTLWTIRLEEIYQKAKEKGHVSDSQKDKMLKNKFWRGLRNTELKNATRVHFEKDKVGFEMLRTKVRAAEYELSQDKIVMSQDKTTLQKDVKVETKDTKEGPIKTKDKDTSSKIEIQHQTVQQESSTKLLIDIAKKMEDFEKRLDEISRGIPNRSFNRGRGRGATGPPTKTPQGKYSESP